MITSLLASLAFADDLPVESRITDVVVYTDRARITRTVSVDIPSGRTDLVFEGLPLTLLPPSLSAEGEGTAGATLTGIDVRTTRGVEDRDERISALKTERRAHEDAIRVQTDIVARVQKDIAFVTSLKPVAPGRLSDKLFLAPDAAGQLGTMSKQIGADLVALYKEQRAAEDEIQKRRLETDRIDRELYVLGQGTPDANTVAVGLDAPRAGRVTVRLQYVTTEAGWSPHWDARFRPSDSKVKLDLSGEVSQTTGESWDDVRLTLSTARANESTSPPALAPFYLTEGYGRGTGASSAVDKATAVEFAAPAREDVPTDGTQRRVYVTSLDMTGKIVHQVVARRQEAAYLTARVTNGAEFALLPGGMSSYMGTAYVGEGSLDLTPPGAEVDLSFGVDDRVRVKRTRMEQVSSDAKPLQNREHQRYGWKTAVTNRTGKPITLVVVDQVPVSREAAFIVEAKLTPAIEPLPSDGVFTWTVDVPEGKTQDFLVEYDVSWPQGDRPVLME